MKIDNSTVNPSIASNLRQDGVKQPAEDPASPAQANGEQVSALPTPYTYPPGWYWTRDEVIEHSRGGVSVDYLIKVIDEPDEVRAARAKAEKDRLAQVASSYSAGGGLSVPDNHDTIGPNLSGLSLRWANVVRDVVLDVAKKPGPGKLYGAYGDKTTSSPTELLGWIDDYIAKLSAEPPPDA